MYILFFTCYMGILPACVYVYYVHAWSHGGEKGRYFLWNWSNRWL